MKNLHFLACTAVLAACSSGSQQNTTEASKYELTGSIERLDPRMTALVNENAVIEVVASGFTWSEGPVWVPALNGVVFTDVHENTAWLWTEKDSLSVYLKPSGYTGDSTGREGANGLILDAEGRLVLCQHGDRQLGRMNAPLDQPASDFTTLTNQYDGKRYNSPNDVVMNAKGQFFFTDPPYGLKPGDVQEMDYYGVYRLDVDGTVTLLIDSLTRPNGVALSPDEKTLYVAVSDPQKARYYAYNLDENGSVTSGRLLLDVTPLVGDRRGLPDGLKVDNEGNLFATGPGGVLVISPDGTHLGTIMTGQSTANCGFNADKSVLYMTAHKYLMRIKLKS